VKSKMNSIGRLLGLACIAGWVALQSHAALMNSSTNPGSVEYPRANPPTSPPPGGHIAKEMAVKFYSELPLRFEANVGHADSEVEFIARGRGYNVYLTAKEAVMEFPLAPSPSSQSSRDCSINAGTQSSIVRMKAVGARAGSRIVALDELPGKSNCFIGNDPNTWRADITTYARVKYEQIYPGVDMVFHGKQRQLEYDFIVAPGADFKVIRMNFDDAPKIHISRSGDLVLETPAGELRHRKPTVYQQSGNSRSVIRARYIIRTNRSVGFEIGPYDKNKQLIIDPVVSYATYLGGAGDDSINAIAVDSSGNAYVTGQTSSLNFPITPGSVQGTFGSALLLAFVTKLNLTSNTLAYSTYIGGQTTIGHSSPQTIGEGIALDSKYNAYLTGRTTAIDFPTTPGAFQATWSGTANFSVPTNAFVTKLNQDGSALLYSTYLGGSRVPSTILGSGSATNAAAIAVDGLDYAYVTGSTNTLDFPTTTTALQPAKTGDDLCSEGLDSQRPCSEGFVTKLNQSGTALVYSTYLGGNGDEVCHSIAVDGAGNAYITGTTDGTVSDGAVGGKPFPTAGPLQPSSRGGSDAFVSKLNADATALIYSTYLGGSANDFGNGIAVDSAGNAYVAGTAYSTDLAVTPGAFQTGSASVTLFKTTDGGMLWKASHKGLPSDFGVHLLAVDRTNPGTIYAGISRGPGGVFKSVDGGSNWSGNIVKDPFGADIVIVAFDPLNPSTSYAAFNRGNPFSPDVRKSQDGGRTWGQLNLPFPFGGLGVGGLAIDPTDSAILYFGTQFKSSDGGFRWKQIGKGILGSGLVLAIDPTNSSILYAKVSTVGGQPTGLFRSTSGGKKWNTTELSNVQSVAFDPLNRSRIYAGGDGIFKSDDGGATWKPVKTRTTLPPILQLLVDPVDSSIIYANTTGGFFKSLNRGKDWMAANTGLPAVALYVAIDPKNPSTLYAGIGPTGADAFVAKLNAVGSAFAYLTYLGGGNQDRATSIAVDLTGSAYVTGATESNDFPLKNALPASGFPHIGRPFLTRLNPVGADVEFSTYLGGSFGEARGVAVDATGGAYIVGATQLPDLATTAVAFQKIFGGGGDGFLIKLDSPSSLSLYPAHAIGSRTERSLRPGISGNSGRHRQ
jgi:Beta-propeller repeat